MKSLFIGDATLLIRCAAHHLEAGLPISAVVTRDRAVVSWAMDRGISVIDKDDLLANPSMLDSVSFDVLFSVANLDMLPDEILARAPRSYNFHDGPLPRYAGLNATAWALLNEETEHGVTWHVIEAGPDTGAIAVQAMFPIDAGETAASLNAKCYEAGFSTFRVLHQKILDGSLEPQSQSGQRSYFGRLARPADRSVLDPSHNRARAVATVRALNFGRYENRLEPAKILIGDELFVVGEAEMADAEATNERPGTILSATEDALFVMFVDGPLRLSGLRTCEGHALDARQVQSLAAKGEPLHCLTPEQRDDLGEVAREAAASEDFWRRRYVRDAAFEVPYPRRCATSEGAKNGDVHERHLTVAGMAPALSELVAAVSLWVQQATGASHVPVEICTEETASAVAGIEPFFSSWRLVLTKPESAKSRKDMEAAVAEELTCVHQQGPMRNDLGAQAHDVSSATQWYCPSVGVVCGDVKWTPGTNHEILIAQLPGELVVRVSAMAFTTTTADLIAKHLEAFLQRWMGSADDAATAISLVPDDEAQVFAAIDAAAERLDCKAADRSIVSLIAEQAARTPDRVALRDRCCDVTYAELEQASDRLAAHLGETGIGRGAIVGVCHGHEPQLVIALLAILKAGAAYLPLDPGYPAERLAYMIEDSGAAAIVGDATTAPLVAPFKIPFVEMGRETVAASAADDDGRQGPLADDLAYVIYTSGSTGRPKGVQITHANVVNFFSGMDERIAISEPGEPGTWLSVTSVNFDISVLELFWTLTRGFTVAMHVKQPRQHSVSSVPVSNIDEPERKSPSFSLFYFANAPASESSDTYRLLLEGARFADRAGFEAVWTPERHFHEFGGLYPNPAVTSAAIAAATERVAIRAGSCVAPLHHPIRIAEDWAVVDNLSNGRAGIAFAAGWNPNDFVLAPDAFRDAKGRMIETLDTVQRLWRGEAIDHENPKGETVAIKSLPRPVQPELPAWLTAARNPETFEMAGRLGVNVLTHMLGMSLDEVAANIRVYRNAWRKAGHAGEGRVTLMLHTFVGADQEMVRDIVREPMKTYLSGALDLVRTAAWSFPTIRSRAAESGQSPSDVFDSRDLTEEERDALMEHAFNRYFETSGLFGTPTRCLDMVHRCQSIGVNEIACLIDFGIDTETVLEGLPQLKSLMDLAGAGRAVPLREKSAAPAVNVQQSRYVSVTDDLKHFAATHLQCTPSMATMIVGEEGGPEALGQLQAMLVGGEALPIDLARRLRSALEGQLLNMYGPTETTIWSTVCELDDAGPIVPLGRPIANTKLRIRTPAGADCAALMAGELCIGGAGVAPGYWQRPELDQERFLTDPTTGDRYYRTGDLVRRHGDGTLEFLGRIDNQVKIRGHRIELGEIQAAIEGIDGVERAVVMARGAADGDLRLVAYYTTRRGQIVDASHIAPGLAATLPEIMRPSQIIALEQFPMTPNGKVDTKALPDRPVPSRPVMSVPQNDAERTIAEIWCQLIGIESVGLDDNFFDVGGHSLLAVQVQRRITEELKADLSITDMFRFPTVRALAKRAAGPVRRPDGERDVATQRGTSRAQQRMRARGSVRRNAAVN